MQIKNQSKTDFYVFGDSTAQHLKLPFPSLHERLIDEIESMYEESNPPAECQLDKCHKISHTSNTRSFSDNFQDSSFPDHHREYTIRILSPNIGKFEHSNVMENDPMVDEFEMDDGQNMSYSLHQNESYQQLPPMFDRRACGLFHSSDKFSVHCDTFLDCNPMTKKFSTANQDYIGFSDESLIADLSISTGDVVGVRRNSIFGIDFRSETWQATFRKKVKRF